MVLVVETLSAREAYFELPSKLKHEPEMHDAVACQAGVFGLAASVSVLPLPDASAAVVPVPSSSRQNAESPFAQVAHVAKSGEVSSSGRLQAATANTGNKNSNLLTVLSFARNRSAEVTHDPRP